MYLKLRADFIRLNGSLGNLVEKKCKQKGPHIRSTISLNIFHCNNLYVHVCNRVGPQVKYNHECNLVSVSVSL